MTKNRRKQADHRADTRGGALSGLPHVVADSPAYLSLSPFERAVLNEILRRFNGYNNGEIGITYEEIGARLKGCNSSLPNNARIAKAIIVLMDRGLIGEPTPESWLQRKARTYRLTFILSGKAPPFRSATNDYLRWTPRAKIDGDAGSPRKAQSGDARSPRAKRAGDAGSPDNQKNGSFALPEASSSGDAGSLLIGKPYGVPENGTGSVTQIVDGPEKAAIELRNKIADYFFGLKSGRRRAWAEAHGVTADDVRQYCIGDPHHLPPAKIAVLLLAIKNERTAKKAARAQQQSAGRTG